MGRVRRARVVGASFGWDVMLTARELGTARIAGRTPGEWWGCADGAFQEQLDGLDRSVDLHLGSDPAGAYRRIGR